MSEDTRLELDKQDVKELLNALSHAHEIVKQYADLGVVLEKISNIDRSITEMKVDQKDAHKQFVTKEEFKPVKLIAFGIVGLVNLSVIGAILTLVVKK